MATDIIRAKNWDFDETFAAAFGDASPVTTKVIDIICNVFGVERDLVLPGANLADDLGLDELDLIGLVIALEEEFGIEISDEAQQNLRTCGDVVTLVKRLIQERGA